MNPQIQSRWGILCPSCQKKLINPNQPWPVPCATCGTRTHIKCLRAINQWTVDLDIDLDPNLIVQACERCYNHGTNNIRLIQNLPQASGGQLFDVYRAHKARMPKLPKRNVINLWGEYRVDPVNFVPAVSKVLDIVHSSGPKVRWAVKLGDWQQVPMTNLASKEIILPNYFDSPNALGRTHEEILDAMTGAAMHEAGHAAYDQAETIIKAQKIIRPGPGQSTTAAAMCLNIVADYNLERKVIERYPTFRHYFSECHRWSVQDVLPEIVKATQEDGAEDKLNVRLAIVTWEMLGPGDIAAAGGVITPKLQWIVNKCFDILKYSYQKGHLNREDGKLKTARAIYELVRVVSPIGAPPSSTPTPVLPPPPGTQPQGSNQQPQPGGQGQGQGQGQGTQAPDDVTCGFPGLPSESPEQGDDNSDDSQQGQPGDLPQIDTPPDESYEPTYDYTDESEDSDTDNDSDVPEGGPDSPEVQEADEPTDAPGTSGEHDGGPEGPEGSLEASQGEEQAATSSTDSGSGDPDDDGQRSDSGEDGNADDGDGNASGSDSDSPAGSEGQAGSQGGTQDSDDQPHDPDNTGPESQDAGDPGTGQPTSGSRGGKTGSEAQEDVDPFTGKSNLEDDPSRRKNARKDALDDLEEQNAQQPKVAENPYDQQFVNDEQMNRNTREQSEAASNPPAIDHLKVDDYQLPDFETIHTTRIQELAPTIGKLKKVLRFRNIDWGGRQTGRRSGTLTRRHVSRLSTLGSEKIFHKTKPDATPKVRIALLIDESESMRHDTNNAAIEPYIAARNAATALTQALKGIRGVKLWSWGFSFHTPYAAPRQQRQHVPQLRQYVDPYHAVNPASIEAYPMFGGTPTGEAMDHAAYTISHNASPDEKCIVFILTDGEAGGYMSTATAVRKWTGKVTFVHIGIGKTQDPNIPFYVGPVLDTALLPEMLDEAVSEILR